MHEDTKVGSYGLCSFKHRADLSLGRCLTREYRLICDIDSVGIGKDRVGMRKEIDCIGKDGVWLLPVDPSKTKTT
jgi:hypothetical protein